MLYTVIPRLLKSGMNSKVDIFWEGHKSFKKIPPPQQTKLPAPVWNWSCINIVTSYVILLYVIYCYSKVIEVRYGTILSITFNQFSNCLITLLTLFSKQQKIVEITAKRKLEILQFSTSSSFVKIWSACSCKFKAYFWTFWALYHLLFDLETIGVN